jgi:hypothetical protein
MSVGLAGCGGNGNGNGTGNGNGNGNENDNENGNGNGNGNGNSNGNGGDTTDEPTDESTPQTATAVIGERISGDAMAMVVESRRTTTEIDGFQEADGGKEFLILRLAIKNRGDGFADFSSYLQATVKDDENFSYDASFNVTSKPLQTGLIASGEVARGDVMFEVPQDASGFTLVVDLSSFDLFTYAGVEVDLTQEAGSVASIEQSLNVDVHGLGESVSHEDVVVTCHDARTEDQLGTFAKPDDGHEFVVPEIEIENNTSEELRVSTLVQMPLKTAEGFSHPVSLYSGELDREFSETQPIQPGSSRRGKLAYEVEVDSGSRFWTFNYLEFTDQRKAFWSID